MVDEPARVADVKRMRLRYAGTCARCGTSLDSGTTADYDRVSKTVACVEFPPLRALPDNAADPTPAPLAERPPPTRAVPAPPTLPRLTEGPPPTLEVVDGQGGASAAVEYQRRHDARQGRVLTNHPRIGRLLLAVFDDPQSRRAWAVGAEGERMLSEMLATMAGESLRVLNDRRIPRTKANIDHLVVCPSGVFVVDAKRYRNARPELRLEGGLLRPRVEMLYVGGRDRTSLVAGMQKQVALVRAALADQPEVPVRGVLCFIDADWPVFRGSFTMDDVEVVWPKKLKATLTDPGPFRPAADRRPAVAVARGLPPPEAGPTSPMIAGGRDGRCSRWTPSASRRDGEGSRTSQAPTRWLPRRPDTSTSGRGLLGPVTQASSL